MYPAIAPSPTYSELPRNPCHNLVDSHRRSIRLANATNRNAAIPILPARLHIKLAGGKMLV